jgi:hypothetical protein
VTDIFSEVEEDVRKERWAEVWKHYGVYVFAGAIVVIGSVAGWQLWQNYQQAQAETTSTAFSTALASFDAGNFAEAETQFAALRAEAPAGYATISELQLATAQLAQGKRADAIATLRTAIESEDPILSSAARLQLAWLLAEDAPRAEVEELLAPLRGAQSPWRFPALEISAYLDYREGNLETAAASYQALAVDPGTPEGLRQRSASIAQFLRANAPQATNAAAPEAPVEAAAPAEPAQETTP